MSVDYALRLLKELESATRWPLPRETANQRMLKNYVNLYESNAAALAPEWWWEDDMTRVKDYVVDPLAERIPGVWREMLFGEEPQFSPNNKKDADRLDEFIEFNQLPGELGRAVEIQSHQGEVWWRLVSMPALGHVQIEFHSRLDVVPLILGQNVVACAFISVLEIELNQNGDPTGKEWVYVEIHSKGIIYNRLYYHQTERGLGPALPLSDRDETNGLRDSLEHPFDMLAGRILNKRGRKWDIGISDYKGIDGLLLHLSELQNVGQGNARLTGHQRVVIPQRFLTQLGRFPKGAEIIVATEVDSDPDKIKNEFAQIEWKFDAQQLIAWKNDVVDTILTRARIAPPLVGRGVESAQTGPALRARLLDSVLASQGKGQVWDDKTPNIMGLAIQWEAASPEVGGCGVPWSTSVDNPTMKRTSALPEDETDRSNRVVTEVNAEILSVETAIAENHPDWTDQRVQEELARLTQERKKEPAPPVVNPTLQFDPEAQQDAQTGAVITDPAASIPPKPGKAQPSARPQAAKKPQA